MQSWLPGPLCDCGYKGLDARSGEIDRLALLGAHVRRHQDLHYPQSVIECQPRSLLLEEALYEVAVLRLVAVGRGLAGHDRHLPDLGVLLFDEILACFPLHLTAEKELQPGVER